MEYLEEEYSRQKEKYMQKPGGENEVGMFERV